MDQKQLDEMAKAPRRQGLTWAQTNFAVSLVRNAEVAERERCKRIVQLNQYRNGHHTHEGTTMGHYNVAMIAEIDAGLPPRG
mgnify:CR=1 FL=1